MRWFCNLVIALRAGEMSWLYTFKPKKDRMLQRISRSLRSVGVTPNMVTTAGLSMAVVAGFLAMTGHLLIGILFFIISACLDAVDGSLARSSGLTTEFGRYFDSISDRSSELAFVVGAVVGGAPTSAFIVIAGSFILLASRIYNHRRGINSDAAMFGRPERLTLLTVGLIAPLPFDTWLFVVAGFLSIVSSVQILTSSKGVIPLNERQKEFLVGSER
jgi:CDP-diacylglycerol---glycerol-3-phosphate 3-phosphatidyltransferase